MSESISLPQDVENVRTLPDFVRFLELMADDFDADREETELQHRQGNEWYEGRFAAGDTADFLREWAVLLAESRRDTVEPADPPTWRSLALRLYAARGPQS